MTMAIVSNDKPARRKSAKSRGFIRYGSYSFIDKDPVIDEARTAFQKINHGRIDGDLFKQVHEQGGPAAATLRAWFFGKTRRPQSATIEAALRAMGLRRKIVRWYGED